MMWNWVCEIVDTQTGEARTITMQDDLTKVAKWEKELAKKGWELQTIKKIYNERQNKTINQKHYRSSFISYSDVAWSKLHKHANN